MMGQLEGLWKADSFPARRSFDLVLAITLKNNGVREFHTRNIRDFDGLGLFTVVDPYSDHVRVQAEGE